MATWTPATKDATAWTDPSKSFLTEFILLESGSYILLENLGKIILDQSHILSQWTGGAKHTASWVNSTEH